MTGADREPEREGGAPRAGDPAPAHRAGLVAILGRTNAGKSTLLNRILGEKLAIVTAKPQTTRSRILGIHSRPDAQILFLDTPGLHRSAKAFNASLNEQVEEAADDCDVALVLARHDADWGDDHEALRARLRRQRKPVLLVRSQCDRPGRDGGGWPDDPETPELRVSARTGEGVEALLDAVVARLPASPPLYPEDDLSDRPLRWLVAEEVREAAFETLSQELPYSLAVEVTAFDESRPDLVRIEARVLVERQSQKAIVIGRGGETIKRIGIQARQAIERLVGRRVHLALRVKVEPRWAKRPERRKQLGYT